MAPILLILKPIYPFGIFSQPSAFPIFLQLPNRKSDVFSSNDTDASDDVALGRGGYPGFDPLDPTSGSTDPLGKEFPSGPGPANIQSFRSMSEADRRKKEITGYR